MMEGKLRLVVIGTLIFAGHAAAQSPPASPDTTAAAQINARLDTLAAQLHQAQETIDRQQAAIDELIQSQSAEQTGTTAQLAAPQQASNELNPNISLVGDFRGRLGHDFAPETRAFTLREAEVGLQAPVDPFARADAFLSITPDGIDVEEGYFTLQTLPLGILARFGKFRSSFGRFNRTHVPETPFADRPLSTVAFFGEEGLSGVGASFNLIISNPWIFLNLEADITNNWEDATAFGEFDPQGQLVTGGRRRDLGYLTRLNTFLDLNDNSNLAFGTTFATGVHDRNGDLRSYLEGIDLTFRWKPIRRSVYHSVIWQTETIFSQRERAGGGHINRAGMFSYIDWQMIRRWHIGARYDVTQFPEKTGHEQGVLGFLSMTPTEFSLLTWQVRGVRREDGDWHGVGMFKITFNIGPHGAHPF